MGESNIENIVLIGAGPIGLELASALKLAKISYRHIEAGQIGATINWYAPDTRFFSSPERIAIAGIPLYTKGQEKATREEYLNYLRTVASKYQLVIETFKRVSEITQNSDQTFTLKISSSTTGVGGKDYNHNFTNTNLLETIIARKIILAIGDMHHPNLLNISGEDLPHVSHYFEDPHKYFQKNVLIVGGKNSAIEAAIRLYRAGSKVTLVYRGKELSSDKIKYWLYPEIIHLIKKKQIEFLPSTHVKEISCNNVQLVSNNQDLSISPDLVLLLTGYNQDSSLFEQLGIELSGPGKTPQYSRKTMETNIPGVYVAGTAVAGTQIGGVKEFIETSHIHVKRIMAHLKGEQCPEEHEYTNSDFLEN